MYKQSLRLFLKNKKYLFLIVLVGVAAQTLSIHFFAIVGFGVIKILLYSVFSRLIFHELIFGKDNYTRVIVVNWVGFIWRTLLISAIVYLPIIIVNAIIFSSKIDKPFENSGIFVSVIADYATSLNVGFLTSFLITVLVSFVVGQIAFIIITPMILPLIGTLLPAFVKQESMGIANAFRRGKSQFWQITSRIILGPMLVHAISSVMMFFVVGPSVIGQFRKIWEVNISHIGVSIIGELLVAFEIVMIVLILSTAYMTSLPKYNSTTGEREDEQT